MTDRQFGFHTPHDDAPILGGGLLRAKGFQTAANLRFQGMPVARLLAAIFKAFNQGLGNRCPFTFGLLKCHVEKIGHWTHRNS